jgi:hypothetical protein
MRWWNWIRPVAYRLRCTECSATVSQRMWRWAAYIQPLKSMNGWTFNSTNLWRCKACSGQKS